MACINAMYKRLKKLFSSNKLHTPKTKSSGIEEQETLTVNVNPFVVPIEEFSGISLSEEKSDECVKNQKKRNKKKAKRKNTIRRILRYDLSDSQKTNILASSSLSTSTLSSSGENGEEASRYRREFQELGLVGSGKYGSVYRCVHRLDGCVYAVKRSRPLARSAYARRRTTNEVHANAVLGNHKHLVRYFAAWYERDCISIQLEFCSVGDLAKVIEDMRCEKTFYEEKELARLLVHVAKGLRYIHSMKLAHMDIKPENILMTKERIYNSECLDENNICEEEVIYKIGDLGHVMSTDNVQELEDEGDCRYLPKEILREDYKHLTKADIFALGLTIYEASGGGPLPKNGPKWHDVRNGNINRLTRYNVYLNELINKMIHFDPKERPSAADVIQHKFVGMHF